jgi:hypothetical protein
MSRAAPDKLLIIGILSTLLLHEFVLHVEMYLLFFAEGQSH